MKNQMLITLLDKNAKMPTKRDEDAGYDIYSCEEGIVIPKHSTMKLKTGIASCFSKGYVAIVKERGSTAKYGLSVRAGVIDSGYRGEWIVFMTNTTDKDIYIGEVERNDMITYPFSKAIAQFIMIDVPEFDLISVPKEGLEQYKSERMDGGFGSSGK